VKSLSHCLAHCLRLRVQFWYRLFLRARSGGTISRLYLAYISPISRLYLAYILPTSRQEGTERWRLVLAAWHLLRPLGTS
jgi:hypothetical protein